MAERCYHEKVDGVVHERFVMEVKKEKGRTETRKEVYE